MLPPAGRTRLVKEMCTESVYMLKAGCLISLICRPTFGQLLRVNDVTLWRRGVIGVTEVTVWPGGALVVRVVLLTSEDQTEFLVAEEALHEAEIQRCHA